MKSFLRVNLFLILALLFFSTFNSAFAGQITLETAMSTEIEKETLKISVKIKNKGDEVAYSVFPDLVLENKNYALGNSRDLAAGESFTWQELIDLEELGVNLAGTYNLKVLVIFKDANAYSFSTPRMHELNYLQPASSMIAIKPVDSEILVAGKGRTKLIIRNLNATAKEVNLAVFHAKEVVSDLESKKITLAANAQKEINVYFENFKSLSNSTSLVYFICQYEHGGVHFSESANSNLLIEERQELRNWFTNSWLFLLFLLVVILVYIIFLVNKRN